MAEYSRLAKGFFTSTGNTQAINLPFRPDWVELINYTAANSAATSQAIVSATWDRNMGEGFAVVQGYNASPALIYDTVTANGISTFSAGLSLQYGPTQQVVASTKGSPTTSFQVTGHGYVPGDVVIFTGLYSTQFTAGMPQMDGIPFTVAVVTDANNFTVTWNSNQSNYTNLAASPTGALVRKVLYPYLYEPGVNFIAGVTTGTTTTISTTSAHNYVVGQEVAFRIPVVPGFPGAWGITQLNALPNVVIPGSPIYGYVVSVTDYHTFVVNIDSTSFTPYNSNVPVASVRGLSYPQVVAVGDVNTGGALISAGSVLYPPPYTVPIGTTQVPTINGPGIQGAFFNNTSQGFIVGIGAGTVLTTGKLVGANGNVIYYRAYLHDKGV